MTKKLVTRFSMVICSPAILACPCFDTQFVSHIAGELDPLIAQFGVARPGEQGYLFE